MDLKIEDQHFLICGASSGFGKAISHRLLEEGARVTGVARSKNNLEQIKESAPGKFSYLAGNLTEEETLSRIKQTMEDHQSAGLVLNAGGPPPGSALEPSMKNWDEAYELVMRWKIDLVRRVVPLMKQQSYGRILFIESQSIKQPISDLVLSNAFRAGIAGFAMTLSREVASGGITVNILAPGAHETPAIERVIEKKAKKEGISKEQARKKLKENIPVGRMGQPGEISSLAAWILSPLASYITGQILSHEGGNIESLFG